MKTVNRNWMALALVGSLLLSYRLAAQTSGSAWPGHWQNGAVSSSASTLSSAERSTFDAWTKFTQANFEYRQALAQFARLGKEIRNLHRASEERVAALKERNDAETAFKYAREPVLADLARLPAYRDLVEKREHLRFTLANDPQLVGPARTALANELLAVTRDIRGYEQAAIAEDVAASKAQIALRAAEERLSELRVQLDEEVELDPRIVEGRNRVSGAYQALVFAEQDLATEAARLGLSRREYRRAALTDAVIWDPRFWYGHYWWR